MSVDGFVGYVYLIGLERGSGRVNRKWCARTGTLLPAPTQSGINTPHNSSTDILHSPAYEDGTDSEFRNVGN